MKRRDFIQQTTLAGAGILGTPGLLPGLMFNPKRAKYRTALIGSGWWGLNILREGIKTGEVQVVALCDVDQNQLSTCQAEVGKLCSDQPRIYRDFRECLAKEKPEIVINATPDHWHALIAIAAMQQGAHVYLEKPISHTVKEGLAIEKTARDTQKICIVGFHRRYSPHNVSGINFLKAGKAGKIHEVKAFVQYNYGPGKLEEPVAAPAGLDWDFWCGPAPLVDYHPSIHPRGFRQYMEFANGQIGDWGPHWFDQILWWTEEKFPKKIYSSQQSGLRTTRANAPELQTAVFEFEDFICTWQHSLTNAHPELKSENVGVYFYGTEGTFHLGWQQGWTFFPNDKKKEPIHEAPQLNKPDDQNIDLVWRDFLASIKSGQLPLADVARGRLATNMALLAVVSAKVGRSIDWDLAKDRAIGDKEANQLLARNYRGAWEYPKV
jgi:predicted dehydrogenase